ncbi:MAG: RNA polymerase subunit sigma-70 [Devosiaceae bacterium]|nr:RNA polymerase subunit sigma-70 [Devosiaceae bacterium MH13]
MERVARTAYGRIVAILAKRTGDLAAAEDALADAFAQALRKWPEDGIPKNPESWLVTVARNRDTDRLRSSAHRTQIAGDALSTLERRADAAIAETMNSLAIDTIPDERLKLMFVCAHPAIGAEIRTPLMLQTILGLDAATIGTAFAVPAATMAQRLVRAKAKIKQAAIPFELPDQDVMPERLDSVLEAIYGAYATHWMAASGGTQGTARDLCQEALFLADLIVDLLPDHAEALGLAALVWFIHARSAARLDETGALVPLDQQDTALWNRMALARAQALLGRASAQRTLGRYQLEAAIQSVHAARAETGRTDWGALVQLYEGVLALAPTLGAAVAQAAAVGEAHGPEAGLRALERLDAKALESFQPAWATRAHLLAGTANHLAARSAFQRAIDLATDVPSRRHLEKRLAALLKT